MKKLIILLLMVFMGSVAFAKADCSDSSFTKAVKNGDTTFVKENISKIENINSPACFLCSAAMKKQNEVLDILIENKADVNCPNSSVSPLYAAVVFNNNYAVEKLLKAGADPNNKTNLPIIYLAVANNNTEIAKQLLEAGADYNATFMKISVAELAFMSGYSEMSEVFVNYWNKRFETPATDVNKVLDILKESKSGNKYYNILAGENPTQKPFKIVFVDTAKIGRLYGDASAKQIISYEPHAKQIVLYLDNEYRNLPPELLAPVFAAEAINTDGRTSVVEQLVCLGVMGDVWREISEKNPKLTDDKQPLIKGYNGIVKIMDTDTGRFQKGNYNNLWVFSGIAEGCRKTSKGFRNKDLNTYFE